MKIEVVEIPENEGGGFGATDLDTKYRGDGETIIDAVSDLLMVSEFMTNKDSNGNIPLKPCPCCGGSAHVSSCVDYLLIFCGNCSLRTDEFRQGSYLDNTRLMKAANNWNKRHR